MSKRAPTWRKDPKLGRPASAVIISGPIEGAPRPHVGYPRSSSLCLGRPCCLRAVFGGQLWSRTSPRMVLRGSPRPPHCVRFKIEPMIFKGRSLKQLVFKCLLGPHTKCSKVPQEIPKRFHKGPARSSRPLGPLKPQRSWAPMGKCYFGCSFPLFELGKLAAERRQSALPTSHAWKVLANDRRAFLSGPSHLLLPLLLFAYCQRRGLHSPCPCPSWLSTCFPQGPPKPAPGKQNNDFIKDKQLFSNAACFPKVASGVAPGPRKAA